MGGLVPGSPQMNFLKDALLASALLTCGVVSVPAQKKQPREPAKLP
jgi:hypothetical protein